MRIRTNGVLNLDDAGTPEAISIFFGSALDGRYLRVVFDDYSEGAPLPLGGFVVLNNGALEPDSGGVYAYNTDDTGQTFVTGAGNAGNIVTPYVPNQLEFASAMGGNRQAIEYARAVNGPEGTFTFDLRVEMYDDVAEAFVPVPDDTPVVIRGYDRYNGNVLVSNDLVADGLVIAGAPPAPSGCFWTDFVNAKEDCGEEPPSEAVFFGVYSTEPSDFETSYGIWAGEELIPVQPGTYSAPITYRNINTIPRASRAFVNDTGGAPVSDIGVNGSNQFVSQPTVEKIAAYYAGRRADYVGLDLSSYVDDPYNVGPFPSFYFRLSANVAVTSPVSAVICTPRYLLQGDEFWRAFDRDEGEDFWRSSSSPLVKANAEATTWPYDWHTWMLDVRLLAANNTTGNGTNSMTFTQTAEIGIREPRKVHAVIRNIERYPRNIPEADPNFDLPATPGTSIPNRIFFVDRPANSDGTWVPRPVMQFENDNDDGELSGYLYVGDMYEVTPSGEVLLGKAKIRRNLDV